MADTPVHSGGKSSSSRKKAADVSATVEILRDSEPTPSPVVERGSEATETKRASPEAPPTRLRLDIAYDGTDFRGWARQPGLRTVQGILEAALERLTGAPAQLVVAGRTDAGVHAAGQVAHVDLTPAQLERIGGCRLAATDTSPLPTDPSPLPVVERGSEATESKRANPIDPAAVLRRLNSILRRDPDVVVTAVEIPPPGFDARFSPLWRRYEYRIADDLTPLNPMRRRDTTRVRGTLDVERMTQLGHALVGLHDFAAFCKPRPEATTIRTLLSFTWRRDTDGTIIADIAADAFCHSMVRALVGASVAVGDGKLDTATVLQLREDAERTSAFKVLEAHGLTLVEVAYPADDELAARAGQTRARRAL